MSIGTCCGLCYDKERAYLAWKYPSHKSSSEHTLIITNDKYLYNPKKINERVKYDSYIRVLRRRRNQNMPCNNNPCMVDKLVSPPCKLTLGQLCSIDKSISPKNQTQRIL